jgi:hypothetical protein
MDSGPGGGGHRRRGDWHFHRVVLGGATKCDCVERGPRDCLRYDCRREIVDLGCDPAGQTAALDQAQLRGMKLGVCQEGDKGNRCIAAPRIGLLKRPVVSPMRFPGVLP